MSQIIKQKKASVSREELISRLPIPGPGRPKLRKEQKLINKAVKDWLKDYEQGLLEKLPEISDALITQAKKGNIPAIAEIHKVIGAYKRGEVPLTAIQINFKDEDLQ